MPLLSIFVILGSNILMLVLGLAYFRRYRVKRPPVGVINRTDVLSAMLIIIVAHALYVVLPVWAAVGLFALAVLSALYCTLEPLFRLHLLAWLVAIGLIVGDCGAALVFGVEKNGFLLVNDLVILFVIIGVSNLWVQSGLKAGDAVLFSLLLAVFDLLATSLSPLTFHLFARLQSAPLTPALAWASQGTMLSGGLGDFLLVTVFTLTLEKAYGRVASCISMLLSLLVIAGLLLAAGQTRGQLWPAMVFLAPLMLGQYLFWRRRSPQERTMGQYVQPGAKLAGLPASNRP